MPIPLLPNDPHDDALRSAVRPPGWVNPSPAPMYNLVVIGGGPAGLVAAAGAAGLGAKVALVERDLLGGDCLNVGCVPSKTLLRAAAAAHHARTAARFGVRTSSVEVDFPAVMERVRRVRASLSPNDSAERFRSLGVDVFLGDGRFVSADAVEVGGQTLRFRKCILATGARAKTVQNLIPRPPSLGGKGEPDSSPFPPREGGPGGLGLPLTNETLFALTTLPRRLLVIGAGPVGCELGQAFARLGSSVTLVATTAPLPHEHPDASRLLSESLQADGVRIVRELPPFADFDAVLSAVGRTPNVESLNLPAAGVEFTPAGVRVDDHLRTTNRRVYAAGDVCDFGQRFTHAADAMARIAVQNALFPSSRRASALVIPRCIYTDPEVAAVGSLTEGTAFRHDFAELDRAVTDGGRGFIEVRVKPGTDRIVGATVVGPRAGEVIAAVSLTMANGLGLKSVGNSVFPYPAYTDALKKVADAYNRTRLTPLVTKLMRTWLRWRR